MWQEADTGALCKHSGSCVRYESSKQCGEMERAQSSLGKLPTPFLKV